MSYRIKRVLGAGIILLLSTDVYSNSGESEFVDRLNIAKRIASTNAGKIYEAQFRKASRDADHTCFVADRQGGTVGWYQLVATVNSNGFAKSIEVKPSHGYSECVAAWAANYHFPQPPTDEWPVYLEIDIQP